MLGSLTVNEPHGCIVCGKIYRLHITLDAEGIILECSPADPGVRVLPHPDRPLIACTQHAGVEVAAALAEQYHEAFEHEHEDDAAAEAT
jgi:hypothetical protein